MSHVPVLLDEVLAALDPKPGDFFIDGTVDGGGHAAAILRKVLPNGKFLGVDWDRDMLRKTKKRFANQKIFFAEGNYADLPEILAREKLPKANGLLLDLGFSSEQLESSGRGFSFSEAARNEPLLMTYGDEREPVRDSLKRFSERELADIIFQFGGERRSRQIAKAIKLQSRKHSIETAGALADIVRSALPKNYEHGRIDRATRTFQALRIYANRELENVTNVIAKLPEILMPGGRAAIVSFHSLEDRTVKHAFRELVKGKNAELIYKKPIAATQEEIRENPRSRSAKLRAIKLAMSSEEESGE
jgi:16S rRNA (cytosine1402-N4)-methyltransferase